MVHFLVVAHNSGVDLLKGGFVFNDGWFCDGNDDILGSSAQPPNIRSNKNVPTIHTFQMPSK